MDRGPRSIRLPRVETGWSTLEGRRGTFQFDSGSCPRSTLPPWGSTTPWTEERTLGAHRDPFTRWGDPEGHRDFFVSSVRRDVPGPTEGGCNGPSFSGSSLTAPRGCRRGDGTVRGRWCPSQTSVSELVFFFDNNYYHSAPLIHPVQIIR